MLWLDSYARQSRMDVGRSINSEIVGCVPEHQHLTQQRRCLSLGFIVELQALAHLHQALEHPVLLFQRHVVGEVHVVEDHCQRRWTRLARQLDRLNAIALLLDGRAALGAVLATSARPRAILALQIQLLGLLSH